MDNTPQIQNVYNVAIDFSTMQAIAYTGTAEKSTAVNAEQIALISSSDCHIAFGANPTATANSWLLPAKTLTAFAFNPGDLISVIQDSASGTLWVVTLN